MIFLISSLVRLFLLFKTLFNKGLCCIITVLISNAICTKLVFVIDNHFHPSLMIVSMAESSPLNVYSSLLCKHYTWVRVAGNDKHTIYKYKVLFSTLKV